MKHILFILVLFIVLLDIRAQPFLYTQFPDVMDGVSVGRQNGFALQTYNYPNSVVLGYSENDKLVLQRFFAGLITFPPQPTRQGVNATDILIDSSPGSVMGTLFSNGYAFVAIRTDDGVNVTIFAPKEDSRMVLLENKQYLWSDPLIQAPAVSNPFLTAAISMYPEGSYAYAALSVRFSSITFKILVFEFDTTNGSSSLHVVIDSPLQDASFPDLIPFPSATPDSVNQRFLLAYPYQISLGIWGIQTYVATDNFTLADPYSYTINAKTAFQLSLTFITNVNYVVTFNYIQNDNLMAFKQALIHQPSKTVTSSDIVPPTSQLGVMRFGVNILTSGALVTVWTWPNDNTTIYGTSRNFTADAPALNFTIPAATNARRIDGLVVTPLEATTFAVTQIVRDAPTSVFTNYYALSDCTDTFTTPNENCGYGEGCINCMCDYQHGWYGYDGFTCKTVCGDGFTVGNETCVDGVDENCNQCVCVSGTEFNSEQSKCLAVVLEPTAPGGEPFDNNLIAAIVVVPVGVGAAIFFGVYFGRKRKQQKPGHKGEKKHDQKEDDVPLTSVNGDGKYTAVGLPSPDNKYGAIAGISTSSTMGTVTKTDDKLNVPYTELKFNKEIGAGAYGKVYIGEWQRTKVALKINTLATGSEFEREAKLMVDLRPHPNVVQMLGVSSDGPYPVMILEFCDGGSLDTKLFDPTQPMTAADQLKIVSGIAKGLYHLHKNQIVHRDLAARNILLNFNQPKISDFGLSRLVNDSQKGTTRSNVGPIRWMAPESLKSMTYSTKSDVWSFGIIVYEIVARKEPHSDADQMAIGLQIRDNGVTPSIPDDCDPCLKELMEKCWDTNPENRPSMEQICDMLDKYMEENNM